MELIRKYKQGKLTTADVRTLNNTVICLMILIAATSIVWSVSIHILSGDFHNGFIGAKLAFRQRNFTQLSPRAKDILYQDLGQLINETYTNAAIASLIKSNEITQEMLIMPEQEEPVMSTEQSTTTKKPKTRKIAHLFQTSSNLNHNVPDPAEADDRPETEEEAEAHTTALPRVKFNPVQDRKFLASKTIDIHRTHWSESTAVQFVYSFPFLSEMVAIIWTAMCLIFQSGVKKYWGLPKPWRIVIPSICVFSLMTVGTLVYTILTNGFLKAFCNDLKENLTNPHVISCGEAISVLRPIIRPHEFKHDVYLNLFRISYLLVLVLWLLALLVMVLRYIFAIDFQLVDVETTVHVAHLPERAAKEAEFTEVLLNSPQHPSKLLQIDERHRSEDDFQSAKSHQSGVVTPLLDQKPEV